MCVEVASLHQQLVHLFTQVVQPVVTLERILPSTHPIVTPTWSLHVVQLSWLQLDLSLLQLKLFPSYNCCDCNSTCRDSKSVDAHHTIVVTANRPIVIPTSPFPFVKLSRPQLGLSWSQLSLCLKPRIPLPRTNNLFSSVLRLVGWASSYCLPTLCLISALCEIHLIYSLFFLLGRICLERMSVRSTYTLSTSGWHPLVDLPIFWMTRLTFQHVLNTPSFHSGQPIHAPVGLLFRYWMPLPRVGAPKPTYLWEVTPCGWACLSLVYTLTFR